MNLYDDENEIMELFRSIENCYVYFPYDAAMVKTFYNRIHDVNLWENWVDNSAKNVPPPDYYSEKYKLMMEVMRIDDHAFKKKGKFINPTNARESERRREIMSMLSEEQIKNSKLIVSVHSGLTTNEDHNYNYYITNFKYVLGEHSKKISLYRKNHPDCKLAFFVFDESTPYLYVQDKNLVKRGPKAGQMVQGQLHQFFFDSNFLDIIRKMDVDYLVWFAPYKHVRTMIGLELPKVIVFDVKRYNYNDVIKYDLDYIMPAEE